MDQDPIVRWATRNLGDGILATAPLADIERRFAEEYDRAGRSPAMAVFVRHYNSGLHCEVQVYFSPAARELAREFGAAPCESPAAAGLELLAGDEACRALLFPQEVY